MILYIAGSAEICPVLSSVKPELEPSGLMDLHKILKSSLVEEVEGDDLADIELIGKTVNSGLGEYGFLDPQVQNMDEMPDVELSNKGFSTTTASSDQGNFFTETSFTPAKSDSHDTHAPTVQPRTLHMSPLHVGKDTSVWKEVWNLNQISQKLIREPKKAQQENTTKEQKNEKTVIKLSPKPSCSSSTVSPRSYTSPNEDKFMNYLSETINGQMQCPSESEKPNAFTNVTDMDNPKLFLKDLPKAHVLGTSHGGLIDGKEETDVKGKNVHQTHLKLIQNEQKRTVSILKSKQQDSHKTDAARRQADIVQLKSGVPLSVNQEIKKEGGSRRACSPVERSKLPTTDQKGSYIFMRSIKNRSVVSSVSRKHYKTCKRTGKAQTYGLFSWPASNY